MSNNKESNVGSWVVIIAIAAIMLYFWKEILAYVGEIIFGVFALANGLLQMIVMAALFVGVIYVLVKLYELIKK